MTLMPAVALATLGALVAIPALSQSRLYAAAPVHFTQVTVRHGEDLWSIADRYTPASGSVQETVDDIEEANHLASAAVIPGQRLQVPR
ncbi:MAG: LysM peptidoglycan-binding domain-containing protein [Candidatus Eremiobacteraeota bacterium]|nr:LysM peptidoglycan-binding domain-containing protein [Candidatus Eremiobacteraeota bacterium]